MADYRAEDGLETREPVGSAQPTHTTVIHETRSSGSGAGIVLALVLLVAVIGGIYLFSQTTDSEVARDNAVAEAAGEVGNAASQIGDAAQEAANKVEP